MSKKRALSVDTIINTVQTLRLEQKIINIDPIISLNPIVGEPLNLVKDIVLPNKIVKIDDKITIIPLESMGGKSLDLVKDIILPSKAVKIDDKIIDIQHVSHQIEEIKNEYEAEKQGLHWTKVNATPIRDIVCDDYPFPFNAPEKDYIRYNAQELMPNNHYRSNSSDRKKLVISTEQINCMVPLKVVVDHLKAGEDLPFKNTENPRSTIWKLSDDLDKELEYINKFSKDQEPQSKIILQLLDSNKKLIESQQYLEKLYNELQVLITEMPNYKVFLTEQKVTNFIKYALPIGTGTGISFDFYFGMYQSCLGDPIRKVYWEKELEKLVNGGGTSYERAFGYISNKYANLGQHGSMSHTSEATQLSKKFDLVKQILKKNVIEYQDSSAQTDFDTIIETILPTIHSEEINEIDFSGNSFHPQSDIL